MSDDEGSGLAGGALRWAFWYCVVMFLMPFFMAVLLYLSASIVFLYGLRQQLRLAYLHSFWDGARHTLAAFWLATGKFVHGTSSLLLLFLHLFLLLSPTFLRLLYGVHRLV